MLYKKTFLRAVVAIVWFISIQKWVYFFSVVKVFEIDFEKLSWISFLK